MILKDWLKVYKDVEERYLINAESSGQEGDIDAFEYLSSEAEKLKVVREGIEKDYKLHRYVNTLQFANLLVTVGVYDKVIPFIKFFVSEKEAEIKRIEDECSLLSELVSIRTTAQESTGQELIESD